MIGKIVFLPPVWLTLGALEAQLLTLAMLINLKKVYM